MINDLENQFVTRSVQTLIEWKLCLLSFKAFFFEKLNRIHHAHFSWLRQSYEARPQQCADYTISNLQISSSKFKKIWKNVSAFSHGAFVWARDAIMRVVKIVINFPQVICVHVTTHNETFLLEKFQRCLIFYFKRLLKLFESCWSFSLNWMVRAESVGIIRTRKMWIQSIFVRHFHPVSDLFFLAVL